MDFGYVKFMYVHYLNVHVCGYVHICISVYVLSVYVYHMLGEYVCILTHTVR